MTVQEIFHLGIRVGIDADPRGRAGVRRYLDRMRRDYDALPKDEKAFVDEEAIRNPFPDSAIHVNDGKANVKRVLAGIDITASDILLASQLGERGKPIDLVIAHHPVGKALANLHEVMAMSADFFSSMGVPVHLADKITEDRMREVSRGVHGMNHYQAVNVAKLLGVNFINTHTVTDNLVHTFIEQYLKKKRPETIGDLMKGLLEIPEYREAKRLGAGPRIFAGAPTHRTGNLLVEMTGGTEPSNKMYEEFSRSGISTVVGMHMREQSMEKANEYRLNIVIAGHISSDSIGMNLFLDHLEKRGIEIIPCGGLIRVSRNKKKKSKK